MKPESSLTQRNLYPQSQTLRILFERALDRFIDIIICLVFYMQVCLFVADTGNIAKPFIIEKNGSRIIQYIIILLLTRTINNITSEIEQN